MKMVIVAYPTRQIPISIVQDLDSQFLLEAVNVGYKDLYDTVIQLKARFPEVDEIVLFGPEVYLEQIAQTLGTIFESDNELQISIMVNGDRND